jgi:hypothetical protein
MNNASVKLRLETETKDPYLALYIKVGSEVDGSTQDRDQRIREPIYFGLS